MKIGFATILTLSITLGTWLVSAFQTNWSKSAKKTTTLYRSLSGLISSSSQALSSLAPSIPIRGRDMNMISSHHVYTEPKTSFWPFSYFSSSSKTPSLREIKQADDIMRNYKASAEAASSSRQTVKSVHVAGFMDYDPKIAAKNAYRTASTRRDNSWFHL